MKVGEFFLELTTKGDTSGVDNMSTAVVGAYKKTVALKAAILGAIGAMYALNRSAMSMAVTLKNFAVQTGLSTEEMQKWAYAAEQNDISTQELIESLKALESNRARILKGYGNISPYQLLGLNPEDDPFTLLDQLAERIKGLDPAIARETVGQLGISENMLNLLKNGNLEFSKLNEKYIVTRKETAQLLALNRAWNDLFFIVKQLATKMAALNVKPFLVLVQGLKNVADFTYRIASGFTNLIQQSQTFQRVLLGIGAVALVAFAPLTATIAGLFLLVEDLAVYFSGSGNSLTGLIVDGFKNINKNIDESVSKWKYLGKAISEPMQAIGDTIGQVVGLVENFNFSNLERFLRTITKYINPVPMLAEKATTATSDFIKDKLGRDGVGPMKAPVQVSGATSNNTFNTNVYGVDNPSAVKKAVKTGFEESLDFATFQTPRFAS